jgi:hypothetical protein
MCLSIIFGQYFPETTADGLIAGLVLYFRFEIVLWIGKKMGFPG